MTRSFLFFLVLGTTALAQSPIAIPLEPGCNGRITTQVLVNGKGPFHFIVDTATADPIVFGKKVQEELKLKKQGTIVNIDGALRTKVKMPAYRADSIKVGEYVSSPLRGIELDLGECGGILGFTFFRDRVVTWDFPGNKLLIGGRDRNTLPVEKGTSLRFRSPDDVPLVAIKVNGNPHRAVLDSGNDGAFTFPSSLVKQVTTRSPAKLVGYAVTSQGKTPINGAKLEGDVTVGGKTWQDPDFEFSELFPGKEINIGIKVLGSYRLTFYPKRKLVVFQP